MRGIYIVVEGQTEEEFVNTSLRPYFYRYKIFDVRAILLSTSLGHKGGDLNFDRYRYNVNNLLKREEDVIITSFIDFFRLKSDFPKYKESLLIANKQNRAEFLEVAISSEIDNPRFIPYIQLHEFEALLFSDTKGIEYIPTLSQKQRQDFVAIIEAFPNPEMINDGGLTAPSRRLIQLFPTYKKTLFGPLIAEEIGLEIILQKCPRFNDWINTLITKFARE